MTRMPRQLHAPRTPAEIHTAVASVEAGARGHPRRQDGDPRRRRGPRERRRPVHGRREGDARGDQLHGQARPRPDLPRARPRSRLDQLELPMMVPTREQLRARHRLHRIDRGAPRRHHRHQRRRPRAHDPRRDRRRRAGRPTSSRPGHVFPLRARERRRAACAPARPRARSIWRGWRGCARPASSARS